MAEKSTEKKRSGNATLVATALALMVGGTALWSINQSISDSDIAGTGEFAAERKAKPTQSKPATMKANVPEVQANLDIPAPPGRSTDPDVYRVPRLAQTPIDVLSTPLRPIDAEDADTADVKPETPTQEAAADETESLASIATASGATDTTTADMQEDEASAIATEEASTVDEAPSVADVEPIPGASYYIAIGSYIRRANALRVQQKRQEWQPLIREARVEGRNFYRLLIGPFSYADLASARARMRAAGVVGEWPVRADNSTARADLALLD